MEIEHLDGASQSLSISRIVVWAEAESCVHTAVTEYLGKQAESGVWLLML